MPWSAPSRRPRGGGGPRAPFRRGLVPGDCVMVFYEGLGDVWRERFVAWFSGGGERVARAPDGNERAK
eukprot:7812507-Lingulodinium_polyedra.AAC.1